MLKLVSGLRHGLRIAIMLLANIGTAQAAPGQAMTLPSMTLANSSTLFHQVGTPYSDGSWQAPSAAGAAFLIYGPYNSLPAGGTSVTYTLLVDNNSADDYVVATIDVYDSTAQTRVVSSEITRKQFGGAFLYQDFSLAFVAVAAHLYEFRVQLAGTSYVRHLRTAVKIAPQCSGLATLKNTNYDAQPSLQACLNSLSSGTALALPPGKYTLYRQLQISKAVRIAPAGLDKAAAVCTATGDARCVDIRPIWNFLSVSGAAPWPNDPTHYYADGSVVMVNADDVSIRHIIINGDSDGRRRPSWVASKPYLTSELRGAAVNLLVYRSRFMLTKSAVINAVAIANIQVLYRNDAPSNDVSITDSYVGYGGSRYPGYNDFSDGLFVAQSMRLTARNLYFTGNTDYHFILGGCVNCTIDGITIVDTSAIYEPYSLSHAGIGIHYWPAGGPGYALGSDGNFTGTTFKNVGITFQGGQGIGVDINSDLWLINATDKHEVRGFTLGAVNAPVAVANASIALRSGPTGGGTIANLKIYNPQLNRPAANPLVLTAIPDGPRSTYPGKKQSDCNVWTSYTIRPIVLHVGSWLTYPELTDQTTFGNVMYIDSRFSGCVPNY